MGDFDRKFSFVTGKGGVGKTTVSVALARALSGAGRRVLLASTDPVPAAGMLGIRAVTPSIEALDERLSVVWLQPESALREYAELQLNSKTLVKALLDNRHSRSFLAAIPGLHPWAALGKACYHADEVVSGRARFDHVIVDAPATGHGLQMLRVPQVIAAATAPGILKRDAERAWQMLTDPARAGVVVVALPEELPTQESIELIEELRALGLEPSALVLNGCLRELFGAEDHQHLRSVDTSALGAEALEVLDLATQRAGLEAQQRGIEAKWRERGHPLTVLPWIESAATPGGIAKLAALLSIAPSATSPRRAEP